MQMRMFEPLWTLFGDNAAWLRILGVCATLAAIALIAFHIWSKGRRIQRRVQLDPIEDQFAAGSRRTLWQRGEEVLAAISGRDSSTELDQNARVLRKKLIQAGYSDPRAVATFFGLRAAVALFAAALTLGFLTYVASSSDFVFKSGVTVCASIFGYMTPSLLLERRLRRCRDEHRAGFPDFMDLMVVCSQAGLSMEAGMQRIAQEMRPAHRSLSFQIDLALMEIRSGRPMAGAIESLSQRLDIPEARSFATLLHQTEELGSSLTQSLRAYSDDMRNKRMMQAEEKAYALPAKLVVPLTLFVFPVLMVVLMLPVVISVSRSGF